MATLTIEGQKVKVDDAFLSMTPEQQSATVEEIAATLSPAKGMGQGVGGEALKHVNRGIYDSVGGLVDFINPFDQPHSLNPFPSGTGSAVTGLENLFGALGTQHAEGPPKTVAQGLLQGVGGAAGSAIPATTAAKALSGAGGMVGHLAKQVHGSLASKAGLGAELAAGGLSGGAMKGAEEAGAPEWAQGMAGLMAPMSIPAAAGIAKRTPVAQALKAASGKVKADLAPYTKAGAYEVAKGRMQNLAGGRERGAELAGRISDETITGITPAQQTQDPNLMGLENLAASQDPNLRARLEQRATAGQESAKGEMAQMGGDVGAARSFVEGRKQGFARGLKDQADQAMVRAKEKIEALGPSSTEADNSRIISEEINGAYRDMRAYEAELWANVDKDATAGTQNAKQAAQRWRSELGQVGESKIPAEAQKWLLSDGSQLGDQASVRDLHELYSELRTTARNARAGANKQPKVAKIADDIANALLDDMGVNAPDNEVGAAINSARNFSASLHETFDQGAVGRIMKKTIDGDTAIDPELSLERTIGRGGETASVANRQILEATVGRGEDVIEDYIKDRFSMSATTPSGDFSAKGARGFARNNKALLEQYPQLRQDVAEATKSGEGAEAFQKRVIDTIKRSESASKSTLSKFLQGPPEKAVNAVFQDKNPERAAQILKNTVSKDKTGEAVRGLKGAFVDNLISRTSSAEGMSAKGLADALSDTKTQKALSRIFSPAEMSRMKALSKELLSAQSKAENLSGTLSGVEPNSLIEFMVRVGAAKHGANLGGGGGGSLQTASMASSRAKKILGRIFNDRASDIIADAIEDPELMRTLLTGTKGVDFEAEVFPKFIRYMVGGAANVGAQYGEE